jgi:tetratricopeptide (TPR) repeat protein
MSDKAEIKNLLKVAKESIDAKDFKKGWIVGSNTCQITNSNLAAKTCKTILENDKSNYNAWIFFGVALFNMDNFPQTEQAYKKAIELDPRNPLAWRVSL